MYFTIHSEHITGKVEDHPLALSSPTSPSYIPLLGYVRGSPLPGWFKLFHLQAVGYPWSAPALPPDRPVEVCCSPEGGAQVPLFLSA